MDLRKIVVACPGKVMIAGEYSVLRGGRCIAATTDHNLVATFEKIPEQKYFEIHSNLWKQPVNVNSIRDVEVGDILSLAALAAEERFQAPHRGKLTIESKLKVADGVGSSSALRLAVVAAIAGKADDEVLERAFQLQFSQQKVASGYDFATQSIGGLVLYEKAEREFNILKSYRSKIGYAEEVSSIVKVFTGGKGAPTARTSKETIDWLTKNAKWQQLKDISEGCVQTFIDWLHKLTSSKDVVVNIGRLRKFFEATPNFPRHILEVCRTDSGFDRDWTFKTTGAGGEDSLIFVGDVPEIIFSKLRELEWRPADFGFGNYGLRMMEQ